GREGPGRGPGQGRLPRHPRPVPARAQGRPGRRRPQPAARAGGAGRSARGHGGGGPVSADVFAAVEAARRQGRTVVMGTTVRTEGDPPSAPGNRALFGPDGALVAGTIGCNGLDRKTGRDGAGLLAAGERSTMRSYTSFEGEPGEGVVEVFLEAFAGQPRLVVGGAGPVADALAAIGPVVGLAGRAEAPGWAGFEEAGRGLGAADAVVFVDHDDPALVPALTGVLGGPVGYVGGMGSRRPTHR